ncbi:hypothetical protein BKA67DRAFT_283424 [Truncatella angustata]|uniref:Uncharacterized protein n=1 Tax=Truncatella angustata TaxID=152316 RepID=A0A9P8UM32_9PEZI|nr:uncharacterized protein BKA67DRAFT_283424 [Truncatella angustata]KAH6654571.1 hypothetical protein BKA67DRAFT_283424 [Truncatella angustata]
MGLWRRKPSASSSEGSNLSGTVTPVNSEEQELSKTTSRFSRTFGWSSKPKKPKPAPEDPVLDRPFTQQNLEHQALFENFTFNFGRRKLSHGGRSTTSGISPSASRNTSVDSNKLPLLYHDQHYGDRRDTHPKFSNSLANEAPKEVPGEESDGDIREHLTIAAPGPPFDTLSTRRNLS